MCAFFKMAESLFGSLLVCKRNTKSSMWQNFGLMATENGKVIENEQEKPICQTGGKGVLAKGSNTTNLFQHIREHHQQIHADLAPLASKVKSSSESEANTKQPSLSESIACLAKYLPDGV